jgi:hypothetical protein
LEPAFGWTLLSRDAIRRAEARLREDTRGVRDEIGFLFLHQAYSDRFFPGTSVQQTRLRYALFVPWIYEKICALDAQRRKQQPIEKMVLDEEVRLTGRLLGSGERDGVIGQRVWPQRRASSQPASMVYWTALGAWGILRQLEDQSLPSRTAVHRMLAKDWRRGRLRDEEGAPIEETHNLFVAVPKPPDGWKNQPAPITFKLTEEEYLFLKRQILTTRRQHTAEPSLFARLAETPGAIQSAKNPWDRAVSAMADQDDRQALSRARRAAAISAIGRAVYAYLLEELRDCRDQISTSDRHRTFLATVLQRYQKDALDLDISAMTKDALTLPGFFVTVLEETQRWLRDPVEPKKLLDLYAATERRRKGNRARLVSTPIGRQRRAEWNNEKHPLAEPLHYRWGRVHRMLCDLEEHD